MSFLTWIILGLIAGFIASHLVQHRGEGMALDWLVGHLRGRRLGFFDRAEPTGIMTHHRVQEGAAENFLDRLLALTLAHPAARWLAAGEVFAPGIAGSA